MYFRLNADKITHIRKVFSLYNWLGSIGGATFVVYSGFGYLFGGYCDLNLVVEVMTELYNDKYNDGTDKLKKFQAEEEKRANNKAEL